MPDRLAILPTVRDARRGRAARLAGCDGGRACRPQAVRWVVTWRYFRHLPPAIRRAVGDSGCPLPHLFRRRKKDGWSARARVG